MENIQDPPPRRRFLYSLLLGTGVALVGAALWPMWRFLSPLEDVGERERAVLLQDDIPVGSAQFLNFRGRPAVVLHRTPGEFLAFSAVCTHLGCIIQWLPERDEFFCPCHAGRFASDGRVLGGPPPRPLDVLPVALSGDQVLIG